MILSPTTILLPVTEEKITTMALSLKSAAAFMIANHEVSVYTVCIVWLGNRRLARNTYLCDSLPEAEMF